MAARILKGITGQWTSCVFLLTALIEQGAGIAAAQLRSVTPHLEEGDGNPDFLTTIVARARRLKASMLRLLQADHKLFTLKARLTFLRESRKALIAALAAAIVNLRSYTDFHYENPDLVSLGLHSPREYQPEPLFRQALLIDEMFQRDDVEQLLGERKYEDGVDLQTPVAEVTDTVTGLRTVLDDLYKTRRHFDEALIEKDKARSEHGDLFIYTARSFEADCHLAGKKELAKRVRPSEKRPGETEVEQKTDVPLPGPEEADPFPLPLATLTLEESEALSDSE